MSIITYVEYYETTEGGFWSDPELVDGLVETSPVGLTVVDADGTVTFANDRAEEIYGRSTDELEEFAHDDPRWDLVDEDGDPLEAEAAPFNRVVDREGEIHDQVLGLQRPSGERVWVSVNGSPQWNEDGELERVVFAFEDVTDRRGLRSELDEILGRVTDAFYALDEEFRFTHVNERAEELLQATEDELLGGNLWELYPEAAEVEEVWDAFHAALETQTVQSYDLYFDPLDFWVEATIYPSETGVSVYFRDITERKERESEREALIRDLRESEERLRLTLEAGKMGSWELDLRTEESMVRTPRHDRIFGYEEPLEEWSLETFLDHVHPEDREEVRDRFDEAFETGNWGFECRIAKVNGEQRVIEAEGEFHFDDDGEPVRAVGVVQDITERKQRERELEEYRRWNRTLMDNFPNGAIALVDPDRRYITFGGTIEGETELTREDIEGSHVREDLPERIADVVAPGYEAALEGTPSEFEATIDGRTYRFHFVPVRDDMDRVLAATAISQDITERKMHERELERRAHQQRIVAELGQFALEVDDLDELMSEASRRVAEVLDDEYCAVLELDPAAEELLLRHGVGWRDGIVGETTLSAVDDDSQAAYTLSADHPVAVEDLRTESRFNGPELLTSHDVRSGISTIIGSVDDPWGVLGTHDTDPRNITEEDVSFVRSVANVLAEAIYRHENERELEGVVDDLEESNERLEQFAYAASHDLQEPLRMVSSYLQLLESRYSNELDDDGEEFIEFAVDGAERMKAMIDGLLEYSRVESRGDPFEPVDLNAIVDDARTNLGVKIDERDAEIRVGNLPRVEGDPSQLQQLFQNLLDNGIKYSGEDPPRIHVTAERDGGTWRVSVRDEGIGIDPDDADRVFGVFQRLHTRDEHAGTGIGLALCKRIVERHGGTIRVDSGPGAGSTFSVTLPAVSGSE